VSPEHQARSLLEEHGINVLPVDPFSLAKALDVTIQIYDYGTAFEGMLIVNSDGVLLGINSNVRNPHRKKFTCAHELGHFSMDIGIDGGTFQCASKEMESFSKKLKAIEVRANKFAAELLLPKFLIEEIVKDSELSWNSIKTLAQMSDVSITAAAKKFVETTDESCVLVVSEDKMIKWFQPSANFRFRLDMDGRLLSTASQAYGMFEGVRATDDFVETSALEWVSARGAKRDHKILEWSLSMDSYGRVLTLLWDDQGFGEEEINREENEEDDFDPQWGWETPTFHKSKRKR
jgi:hypothetical protein